MKKITSIILASLLTVSASASAFAAEVQGGDSREITATYVQPAPDSIYEVDIVWGSMEFDYNSGLKRVWNPDILQYSDEVETEPSWTPSDENGDIVTVKNHSNEGVIVDVAYTKDADNGVDGTLTNSYFGLASAEDTAVEDAPSNSAQLALSTENMPNSFKEGSTNVNVGSLTVTIVEDISTINATAMTNDELNLAVATSLDLDADSLNITLAEDAPAEMFEAIRRALVDAEGVEDGSIDLTLSGVTSIPAHSEILGGSTIFGAIVFDENHNWLDRGEYVREIGSLNLPDVLTIGNSAFESSSITSLNAPKLQTVGRSAFGGTDLTSLYAPNLQTVGYNAFAYADFESVYLPEATTIDKYAFYSCSSLTSANLPKVTSVGDMAFDETALTSLTLTTEEDISIHEDALGYPDTFSTRVDLILNSNKQADVTGAVWNGFTFASISFLCSDGTNNHNYGTAVSNNNNSHSYTCSICGGTKNESCYGEVTCMELATCEACGVKYGELSEHIINPATGYCKFDCGKFMATAKVTNGEITSYYETVEAARRSERQNGATITLLKNVVGNRSEYFEWPCDYTFDLNGYNLDRAGYELYLSSEGSELSLVNTAETRAGIVSMFASNNAEKFTVGSNVDIEAILVADNATGVLVDISNADFASTTIRIDGSGFNVSQINLGNYAVYDASGNVVTGELTSGTTYTIK